MTAPTAWTELGDTSSGRKALAQNLTDKFLTAFHAAAVGLTSPGPLVQQIGCTQKAKVLKKGSRDALETLGIRVSDVYQASGDST
jgi:hypothetical protein